MSSLAVLACCAVLEQFSASVSTGSIDSFSYRTLSVVQTPTGEMTALAQVHFLAPDHYREDASMSFGKIVTVRRGDASWAATPRGVQPLSPDQHRRTEQRLYRNYLGLLWAVRSGRVEAVEVDERTVDLTVAGHAVRASFDPETGRLLALETTGISIVAASVSERREFSDFDPETNLPSRVTVLHDGAPAAAITIKRWKINDAPDPSLFEEPAGVGGEIP